MKSKRFCTRQSKILLMFLAVVMALSMVVSVLPEPTPVKAETLYNAAASVNGGSYTVVQAGSGYYFSDGTGQDDGSILNDGNVPTVYNSYDGMVFVYSGTDSNTLGSAFIVDFVLTDHYENFQKIVIDGVRHYGDGKRDLYYQMTVVEVSDDGETYTPITATSYTYTLKTGTEKNGFYTATYNFDPFDSRYVRIHLYSWCALLQFSEIEIWGEEQYLYQHDDQLEFHSNSIEEINPQYAVDTDADGILDSNMTSFSQMQNDAKMFVVAVNETNGRFLTSKTDSSSRCIGSYLTKESYVEGSTVSPSLVRYSWMLHKITDGTYDNLFWVKSAYDTGYCLVDTGSAVTTQTVGTADNQKWFIVELSDSNGAYVALKNKSTGKYLSLYDTDVVANNAAYATTSADSAASDSRWYVYPILQSFNRHTLYGYAQSGVDESNTSNRTNDVKVINSSIVNIATQTTLTYTAGGYGARVYFLDDYVRANRNNYYSQTFALTSTGDTRTGTKTEDNTFGVWEIKATEYVNKDSSAPDEGICFDSEAWGTFAGSTVVFATDNNKACQRFYILYSMTSTGGYHISPICYNTTESNNSSDPTNEYWGKGFRVYTMYDTALDPYLRPGSDHYKQTEEERASRIHNNADSLILANLEDCADGKNLFYINGYTNGTSTNTNLEFTVKDVYVEEVYDEYGEVIDYTIQTDANGDVVVINEFIFTNNKTSADASATDNIEYGVYWCSSNSAEPVASTYNKLVYGATMAGKIAEYAGFSQAKDGYIYIGYTCTNIVSDNAKNVCYRYYAPYKYTFDFDANTGTDGAMYKDTLNFVYGGSLALNAFVKEHNIILNLNGGTGTESVTFGYDFVGWNTKADGSGEFVADGYFFEGQELWDRFQPAGSSEYNTDVTLYAQWKPKDSDFELPTDALRDGFVFYGWSLLDDGIVASDILTTISDVDEDTNVYAYWIGADYTGVVSSRNDLSVNSGVYNKDTLQNIDVSDRVSYKWYTVTGTDSEKEIVSNAGESTYTVGDDVKGCAIRVDLIVDGNYTDSGYSALIYSDALVDTTPATDSGKDYSIGSVTVEASSTETITITPNNGHIISGIVNTSDVFTNGVTYKVYGVWGTDKVLVIDNGEVFMDKDVDVAKQGLLFDFYVVEITNATDASVTVEGFALSYLPAVYKISVEGTDFDVTYLENIGEDYVNGERATDSENNFYYYEGDIIDLYLYIGQGNKLAAGSYITVNGVKVHPTYSVANSDGYVIFSSVNAYEYYIGRTDSMDDIIFDKEDIEAVVFFEIADNGETTKRELNFGPLGVKLYDKGTERKIRFGTVWYLDDYASDNSWTREKKYGTYIIPFQNILKKKTDNDFYNWILENGTDEETALAEIWYTSYNTVTGIQKTNMLELLAAFIEEWNSTAEANGIIRKMSFGGAEGDVEADYYYLLFDENNNPFIEYSAVLAGIPDAMVDKELIYIPYSSFVYGWNSGSFVKEESYPDNVFIYRAPDKLYTYNKIEGILPIWGELTIEDIKVLNGNTADINPVFTEETFDITYTVSDPDKVTISDGKVITHDAYEGAVVTVTATTKYHTVTFTVTIVGDLVIPDVEVVDGYDACVVPQFLDGTEYDITYSTVEGITIDSNNNITYEATGEYTVTATTEYHTVTFKITVLENPGTVSISNVEAYNYTNTGAVYYDTGDFTVSTDFKPTVSNANFSDVFEYEYDQAILSVDASNLTVKPTSTATEGTTTVSVKYRGVEYTTFDVDVVSVDTSYVSDTIDGYTGLWGDGSESRDPWAFINHSAALSERGDTWNSDANDGKTTMFIGDSIFDIAYWTQFYDDNHYADYDAIILGRSSSTTHDWERTAIDGWLSQTTIAPKNIMINIGTNNFADNRQSAEEVELALKRLFLILHERFPEANIYWFKILPRTDYTTMETDRKTVSTNIETWAAERDWMNVLEDSYAYPSTPTEYQSNYASDGVHPDPANYYIFNQAISYGKVNILMKDKSFTSDQTINGGTGVDTLWFGGAKLVSRYVLTGSLTLESTSVSNAHVQFNFTDNSVIDSRILLWDNNSDGTYNLCFQDQIGSTNTTFTAPVTIEWKIVVTSYDMYFFVKEDSAYVLKAIYKGMGTTLTTKNLIIGSEGANCTFHDMTILTGIHFYDEYEAEKAKAEVQDAIQKSNSLSSNGRYLC